MAKESKLGKQDKKENNKRIFLFKHKPGKPQKPFAAFWTVEDAQKAQAFYAFKTFIINESGQII